MPMVMQEPGRSHRFLRKEEADGDLRFNSGYSELGVDLEESYKMVSINRGEGVPGKVYLAGVPTITEDLNDVKTQRADKLIASGLSSSIVFPVLEQGKWKAIVAMYS